ncbi:7503_t:CDS:2 [Paraglomus occultum]|uniref:DNA-(apurinic or apyrimidinic site) endonuclease n=1 Tax=Paraglomus occultum TaxID=144539 RepID=A0A9N9F285_9GLOM|nr:7503_t:CDS:2 [Paraglomus occultum]
MPVKRKTLSTAASKLNSGAKIVHDVFEPPVDTEKESRPTKKTKSSAAGTQKSNTNVIKQKSTGNKVETEDNEKDYGIDMKAEAENNASTNNNFGPTNTCMPATLSFQKKQEDTIKFASWNVSGLTAAMKKGFETYMDAEDADILCLQETKVKGPLEISSITDRYPHRWWAIGDKKGHGGVAVFSKLEPISVTFGVATHSDVEYTKSRVITLEFSDFYYVACYIPNSGTKLKNLAARMEWDIAMDKYLRQLDEKKPLIWAGDLNVAHTTIDLARPSTNSKTAGFTAEERADFEKFLNGGAQKFVDTWRHFHQETKGVYTYYSYRYNCRTKGIGWRLDYHVVSERLLDRIILSEIRSECYGASDHVPIVMILKA